MASRIRLRLIDGMVLAGILGLFAYKGMQRAPGVQLPADGFAAAVDLSPLSATAVQGDGRLRSFDSHAKTYMGYVSGPRAIRGQSYGFTYLDMTFRPEQYFDVDLIYVKNKSVRAQLIRALDGHPALDAQRATTIQKSGLISQNLLNSPPVIALLQRLGQDLIRTAKAVDAIGSAQAVSDPRFLADRLRLIPPPSGDSQKPWLSFDAIAVAGDFPKDEAHRAVAKPRPIPGLSPALQSQIGDHWSQLRDAWRTQDAPAVNTHLAALAGLCPTVTPGNYPSPRRLALESWYFRNKSMTWVWLLYLVSVIPLLISVINKWDGARRVGMVLFVVAFAAHTASVGIRWYISGRWPNSNMFEAVTTSAWFGGVAAIVLERIARRTPFRNLFALGSAVVSMAALMAAYFLPADLDSAISNKMAALNDVWLYIHTNVIIWSYAVIGLACVPALLLLRHRWCTIWDQRTIPRIRLFMLPIALAILNVSGWKLLLHVLAAEQHGLVGWTLTGWSGAFLGACMLTAMELFAAWDRVAAGASVERASSGGASALIGGVGGPAGFLKAEKPTATQVYDAATMVLVELAFIMLWTGVVMGAIWADHSWGRPWGWDPKEVFALNTFIIFLILIHVRLKVRDKSFWTAVIAVIGFEVMMFNWIVINFIISGLHSYA